MDIGGTGIKGAPVDTESGQLLAARFRLRTPHPATPPAVAKTVAEVAAHFGWQGPIGCGFPAVIRGGIAHTAANVDADWVGTDARTLFEQATGCRCAIANDADVAGLAEMRFGAGQGRDGVVLVVTLGTGIGSALFAAGQLVPNTELALMAGMAVDLPSRQLQLAQGQALSQPGWFAAGNVLGGFHGAQWCYFNGCSVARSVARFL